MTVSCRGTVIHKTDRPNRPYVLADLRVVFYDSPIFAVKRYHIRKTMIDTWNLVSVVSPLSGENRPQDGSPQFPLFRINNGMVKYSF
jgi:hypothetical protein